MSKVSVEGKEYVVVEDIEKWVEDKTTYEQYSKELMEWSEKHKCKLPRISSVRGQILALITDDKHADMVFTREMLNAYLKKIDKDSKDVIQHVNKTDQWGLLHKTHSKKYYYIPRPFVFIDIHIKKRHDFGSSMVQDKKNSMIQRTKNYLLTFYINVPNEKWDMGHVDPNGNNSHTNMIMQPPIQRAYRDRFKFDQYGLRLCPTAQELANNIRKYYSKEEIDLIRSILGCS